MTDVASTKRALAAIDDPRFVPGHPIAGGATGGPARASADLFDAATWFLTPPPRARRRASSSSSGSSPRSARAPVRPDAEAHDRMLALTSHLPHAIANALMLASPPAARRRSRTPARRSGR